MHDQISLAELMPKLIRISDNLTLAKFELMKILPAWHIVSNALLDQRLDPAYPIVETSSGSFALGIAIVCNKLNIPFVIFSDTAIKPQLAKQLQVLGGTVKILPDNITGDRPQEYRLLALQDFLERNPKAFWPRQYDNLENQRSFKLVGDYLLDHVGHDFALVGAVGSGGSTCGISKTIRKKNPAHQLVGVDTFGSILFGLNNAKRMLRGLGNSIMPKNLDHSVFDSVHWVTANDAFYFARKLYEEFNLFCGATTGATYQVARWLAQKHPHQQFVFISADTGERYRETIFNHDWLAQQQLLMKPFVAPLEVSHPLQVRQRWSYVNWGRRSLGDFCVDEI